MPLGYLIQNNKHDLPEGASGEHPWCPLLTLGQAEKMSSEMNQKTPGWKPVTTEGRYVGCIGCIYQANFESNGCAADGIDTSNCRRTKES